VAEATNATTTPDDLEIALPPGSDKGMVRDNLEVICFAMVLILFFKAFVGQQFKIPSASMRNTLMIGDHLLANKFIFARPQWAAGPSTATRTTSSAAWPSPATPWRCATSGST